MHTMRGAPLALGSTAPCHKPHTRPLVVSNNRRCCAMPAKHSISILQTHIARTQQRFASHTNLSKSRQSGRVRVVGQRANNDVAFGGQSFWSGEVLNEDEVVMVPFRWPEALGGSEVFIVGSFNDWQMPGFPLHQVSGSSDFVVSLPLKCGTYQYKFRVDGEWKTTPCDALASDLKGQYNNQRLVSRNCTFVWEKAVQLPYLEDEVFVAGSFAGWGVLLPLRYNKDMDKFYLKCSLPPGTHWYKFLVNGTWMTSPHDLEAVDDDGELCNKIMVRNPPAYHIYYASGWDTAKLVTRHMTRDGKMLQPGWQEVPMIDAPSRDTPSGGSWRMAVVPAPYILDEPSQDEDGQQSAHDLYQDGLGPIRGSRAGIRRRGDETRCEFYIADSATDSKDTPSSTNFYSVGSPGGYKLQYGRITPFSRAIDPPMMLVSDLDGTMVADGAEADAATQSFCKYWEESAALAGSILVYNTGRSLGQFMYLWREKQGALALPDVLITAVGTKVWHLDDEAAGRGKANGLKWREDLNWAKKLEDGWDLGAVKKVAGRIVDRHEGSCHWLDQGTEHPHRIALSCHTEVVEAVIRALAEGFIKADVRVRIITSGTGDWRYVDCVAHRAGKLEALQYVRGMYGVARERCVAAGDSGNDILMLQGGNPAIVVGNAQPELVNWLTSQPQFDHRIVYTDATLAHGILEGMARHGLY